MTKQNYRMTQAILAFISLLVFWGSLYLQYVVHLQPCPLCLMQRFCVLALLCCQCIGMISSKNAKAVLTGSLTIACAGLFFALRHLWLLSLPLGSAPACIPGLDVLMRYFPWQEVVRALLWGSGDCAEHTWHLLGISLPGWAALYFFWMGIVSVFVLNKYRVMR
jgi:disulfide bond formation protein DsbB